MKADAFLQIDIPYDQLPTDPRERHEVFVDCFGRFLFWLRNWSLAATRRLLDSEDARQKLGTIRRSYYDGVAGMTSQQKMAAMRLVEEALNGFGERLTWFLGGRGTDLRFGRRHAYRFQVQIEIVDVECNEVVEIETVSIDGEKFFGSYWGRWLNRYSER